MQEAGEREMRLAGRWYAESKGGIPNNAPLSVWARPSILKACKEAVREVEECSKTV
jgi:hypothetical protein